MCPVSVHVLHASDSGDSRHDGILSSFFHFTATFPQQIEKYIPSPGRQVDLVKQTWWTYLLFSSQTAASSVSVFQGFVERSEFDKI